MSQVLNILKDGKCNLRDPENTIRGGGRKKKSPRKHLQKGSLKRQTAEKYILIIYFDQLKIAGQNKEKWGKTTKHQPAPLAGWKNFLSPALHRNVFITHNKITRSLTWNQHFSLKKKKCVLARKDISTVNKQIKFSLEWIFFFSYSLQSRVCRPRAHEWQRSSKNRPPETATSNCLRLVGWVLFPLTSFLSIQFWEIHCIGWYKLHRDKMQVHLLSRNHLCPWLPDKTSLSKGWKCNAGGRWKVWDVPSWEWGKESKQAQRPVATTYLQHTDGQICSKYNSTREEDPDSCSRMHREK